MKRDETTDTTSAAPASGIAISPAISGLNPRPICRKIARNTAEPKNAKPVIALATVHSTTSRLANRSTGNIGRSALRSTRIASASRTKPPARHPSDSGDNHPAAGLTSEIQHRIVIVVAASSSAPIQSICGGRVNAGTDRRKVRCTIAIETTAIGTAMKKHQRQPKCVTINPPIVGAPTVANDMTAPR